MSASWYMCSEHQHNHDHFVRCNECSCFESLKLLLEHNAVVMVEYLFDDGTLRAAHTLLDHLKQWRERLAELAREILSLDEQANLGLSGDCVLDFHAQQVNKMLRSHGVDSGERLRSPHRDDRLKDSLE